VIRKSIVVSVVAVLLLALVASCMMPTTPDNSVTVYVTNTGSKYHRSGCRYLSQSKIAISLSQAKAQGYTACSVCDPPR